MLPPVWNYPFTYRAVKGSPLSNTEVDDNFKAVAERAEYAQTVAETLPNEIALTAADAATYAANQIAQSALATAQAAAASAAAVVTGGTATLTPEAGKIPLAGGSGYIDNGWINPTLKSSIGLGTAATRDVGTAAGNVMEVGSFGWGATASPYAMDANLSVISGVYQGGGVSAINFTEGGSFGTLIVTRREQIIEQLNQVGSNILAIRRSVDGVTWTPWLIIYHTGNTTLTPDGTLKASSPVINLYTDKHDLHNESQFGATPTVVRKSKGVYEITGTLGLRSDGWYLDTPSDRNGNKYFNIEWTQNITPEAVDGVVDEYRDDIVVTIETFERVWNKETGMFDNGAPIDINDLQDRFVQLRFNEIKVEHEELDDDSN